MDESLGAISRALSDPGLEMASMLFEAVSRIRLGLHYPGLNSPARLSLIASVLDDLCPPPAPEDPLTPLGHVPPAGRDVAGGIAARLRSHPAPATVLLEQFAREPLRVKNRAEETRAPCDTDRLRLPVRHGDRIYERSCDLITVSGVPCARARLTVIVQLLPADVVAGLGSDVPFGELCGPGRLARRARAAYPAAGGGVASTALLVIGGQLAGIAEEEITAGFCEHAARLGGGHGT